MGKKQRRERIQPMPEQVPPVIAQWRAMLRAIRATAGILLDQQMWCFGQDVMHRPHWLLEYGFARHRSPDARCSGYHLDLSADASLTVWGYGVLWRAEGGAIFIDRYRLAPGYAPSVADPHLQTLAALNALPSPEAEQCAAAAALLAELFAWFSGYEAWLQTQASAVYRTRCVDAWDSARKKTLPAGEMVALWAGLAAQVSMTLTSMERDADPATLSLTVA